MKKTRRLAATQITYSREPLERAGLTTEDQVVVPVRIAHVGVRVQLEKLITRDAARSVRANLMADGTWSGSGLGLGLGVGFGFGFGFGLGIGIGFGLGLGLGIGLG